MLFLIIVFGVFFVNHSLVHGLGRGAGQVTGACNYGVTVSSQGTLSNGHPYVSFQYSVEGDDYARYEFDAGAGQWVYEPGAAIQSNANCTADGFSGAFWQNPDVGGNGLIDPTQWPYSPEFAAVNGGTINKIYLGTPVQLGGGYDASNPTAPTFVGTGDNLCVAGVGSQDAPIDGTDPSNAAGVGQNARAYYGINSSQNGSCVGDGPNVYAAINDGGIANITPQDGAYNGQSQNVWCVGYDPGTSLCRGEVASVYNHGCDCAGYLSANNANARSNISVSYTHLTLPTNREV